MDAMHPNRTTLHSSAIRDNQLQSGAIRGHQWSNSTMEGMSILKSNQMQSVTIRAQSEAIRGDQRQSEAINGRHASKSYHSPSKRNGNDSRGAPRLPCTSATLAAADPDAGAVAVGAAADAGSRMAGTSIGFTRYERSAGSCLQ